MGLQNSLHGANGTGGTGTGDRRDVDLGHPQTCPARLWGSASYYAAGVPGIVLVDPVP